MTLFIALFWAGVGALGGAFIGSVIKLSGRCFAASVVIGAVIMLVVWFFSFCPYAEDLRRKFI